MKTYLAYASEANPEKFEMVKEGFSFNAFIFGMLWCVYNKLWLPAISLLAFNIILGVIIEDGAISEISGGVAQIASLVVIGITASQFMATSLHNRGYNLTDAIIARNADEAKLKYIDKSLLKNL